MQFAYEKKLYLILLIKKESMCVRACDVEGITLTAVENGQ